MSESLLEQTETCSACGQPYTAHAPNCPHLSAVKQEHEEWADKAEGMTKEFREEVRQKGPEAAFEEQMESIAESHNVSVLENAKKSDEEKWSLHEALKKLHELDDLFGQARETLNECKSRSDIDLNGVRVEYSLCGKELDEAYRAYHKLPINPESGTEEELIVFRQQVVVCKQRLNSFISKYEKQ